MIWRADGTLILHDVSRDGRALVSRSRLRIFIAGRLAGDAKEHDLSWFGGSSVSDLSADGKTLLFGAAAYGGGPQATYLRRSDGSDPVRLANGVPAGLSPDRKWVIVYSSEASGDPEDWRLLVTPTGSGDARALAKAPIQLYSPGGVRWLPDQRRIVFYAKERNHGWRCYVQDLAGGPPRAVAPEVPVSRVERPLPSGDSRFVIADNAAGGIALYPIDGGLPRPIPGTLAGDIPIQWSLDERFLYVRRSRNDVPARLYRIDVVTGRRNAWMEIRPFEPGAMGIWHLFLSPDGSAYAYTHARILSDAYLVEGLK